MQKINVSELRNHLPEYLAKTSAGETIEITSRGRVVALLVPPGECKRQARAKLEELRTRCRLGDVISPVGETWEAMNDSR
ncbi:MAG: type II toxin-antitoxin system prevent-host-death family antitoxin [Thermodesulfobacteriota bacterium]